MTSNEPRDGPANMSELRHVPMTARGILRLGGEDAGSFLQGLVTNDLDRLLPAHALYAALLTPQGKYLFDFLLQAGIDGTILLDGERSRLAALLQRLMLYRLRARVTIEEASERLAVLAVIGEDAPTRLGLPPEPGAARVEDEALLTVDPRLVELGVRVILPPAAVEAFCARHRLSPGEPALWDRLRLRLGVPDGTRDLVPDRSLLLESGFEELNGVSFTKGCFVGQELTARTKHRALIKKRLVPVRGEGPLPAPGTPVQRRGRDAGELRSGQGELALALLRLEQLGPADGPEDGLRAGDTLLTPVPPAWLAGKLPAL